MEPKYSAMGYAAIVIGILIVVFVLSQLLAIPFEVASLLTVGIALVFGSVIALIWLFGRR